jgi:hypothetical protein
MGEFAERVPVSLPTFDAIKTKMEEPASSGLPFLKGETSGMEYYAAITMNY